MDFLTRLQDSFATLGEIVPALIGALVILFAGYLLAKLTSRGVERLLKKLSVNELLRRGGVMDFAVPKDGSKNSLASDSTINFSVRINFA